MIINIPDFPNIPEPRKSEEMVRFCRELIGKTTEEIERLETMIRRAEGGKANGV